MYFKVHPANYIKTASYKWFRHVTLAAASYIFHFPKLQIALDWAGPCELPMNTIWEPYSGELADDMVFNQLCSLSGSLLSYISNYKMTL